jgi:hypothetical protein
MIEAYASDDPMNTSLKKAYCLSFLRRLEEYNCTTFKLQGPGLTPADGLTVAVGKLFFEENDDISHNACSR